MVLTVEGCGVAEWAVAMAVVLVVGTAAVMAVGEEVAWVAV